MCLTEFDEKKYEEVLKDDAVSFHTYSLVSRGLLTIEEGAQELNMSVEDFKTALKDNGYSLPTSNSQKLR